MAEYLASIFGTEKDKVNCSFYFKIGACRHGDRCSRTHNKPTFSQTILMSNLYENPSNIAANPDGTVGQIPGLPVISEAAVQEHFDNFFEDIFVELQDKYGEIDEMNVCDNLGDHLVGNVYVKFKREEDAERAVNDLNNRWFAGRPIYAELSPVTDFREACCRQYEMGECTRSGFCNFMHLKPISRDLRRYLYGRKRRSRSRDRDRDRDRRRRSRSRDRRRRSRSRSPKRSRSRDRTKSRRHRSRSRDRSPRDRDREGRSSRDKDRDRKRDRDRSREKTSRDKDSKRPKRESRSRSRSEERDEGRNQDKSPAFASHDSQQSQEKTEDIYHRQQQQEPVDHGVDVKQGEDGNGEYVFQAE